MNSREILKILKARNPNILWLLENVMMDKDDELVISRMLGVNPVMIERMMELVEDMNMKGKTFLLVEHNMRLVMELCQHIIVLDHGQKIAEGGPAEIQSNPLVLEAYLGSTQNANAEA